MRHAAPHPAPEEQPRIRRTADLLGGMRVFHRRLAGPLDVHHAISRGFPARALTSLLSKVGLLRKQDLLENAVGMSVRTVQRLKKTPNRSLSAEQSGRTWQFAEVLTKATEVLGSQEDAEEWLLKPAIGLDRQRPLDLLGTPAGAKLVEEYLGRLEYGVYA